MALNLPANIVLPVSPERHNLAVAEIVIFATVLPVQLAVRYAQIRRRVATRDMNPVRRLVRTFFNFIALFVLIRIIGYSLYIGVDNPSKSMVIAEVVLQSVGLSPLLLELSSLLLKCGYAASVDMLTSSYPRLLEIFLHLIRVPVIIGVALVAVAASILNLTITKAGAAVLLAAFVYIVVLFILIAFHYSHYLVKNAKIAFWIGAATLPLYTVRFIYLILVEYGDIEFDPILGNWRYLVGMGFAMEVGIVILSVAAGMFVEPILSRSNFSGTPPKTTTVLSEKPYVEG